MNDKMRSRVGTLVLALAASVPMMWPAASYSETEGMERRDDRRGDRGEARDIKQEGRDEARAAKQECKDADGNRMECRQEKREMKQDTRGEARDVKTDEVQTDEVPTPE